MEQEIAEKIASDTGIAVEKIVREEKEILFLKELFESPLGTDLVFRGGTALRLCYGSPRFSDDLDFSELQGISTDKFTKVIKKIAAKYPDMALTDLWSKRFTHLAEFKITEDWLPQPFRVKIEVRKGETLGKEYELKLLSSEVTHLQALGNTATMQQIFEEKKSALKDRKMPRDLFDLWYLGQKLKLAVDTGKYEFDRKALHQELHKYLPKKYWKAIESL